MQKMKMQKSIFATLSVFVLALSFVGIAFIGAKTSSAKASGGVTTLSERVTTSTTAGTVLKGDKVVIVNTNLDSSKKQPVGTFDFVSPFSETSASSQSYVATETPATAPSKPHAVETASQGIATFTVGDTATLLNDIPSTCIAVGEHCYVFARNDQLDHPYYEQNGGKDVFGKAYADSYDTLNYPYILKASGVTNDEDIPYRGTDKMCILLDFNDVGVAGMYMTGSSPSATVLFNESSPGGDLLVHEVNHFLDDVFGQGGAKDLTEGLAVTLQMHARKSISGADVWIDDLPTNTYLRNGFPIFTTSHSMQYGEAIEYSYHYLFFRYLITQKLGSLWHEDVPEFFALLHSESYAGRMPNDRIGAMEYMVNLYDANEDSDSLSDTIASFFVATVAHEDSGKFGFNGDTQMKATFSYPTFYGNKNHQLAGRSCIVVETVDGEFTIPSDCGEDIRFFAVTNEEEQNLGPVGSSTNPILIYSKDDLKKQLTLPNTQSHYKLANDIDLGNEEFVVDYGWKGNIDGDGHTIKGKLTIKQYTSANISNLTFDINRTQFADSSHVFYQLENGNIKNVHIINSHPDYPVSLAKYITRSNISRCSVIQDANLTSSTHSSFGYLVSGESSYGGSTIENCLVAGNINLASGSYQNVGGFIPKTETNYGDFIIKNSVSAINITSNDSEDNIGTIMGDSNPTAGYRYTLTFQDVYYLSGKNPVSVGNSDGCVDVSSLTNKSEFTNLDFSFLWKMGASYPLLQSNEEIANGTTITSTSIPASTHLGCAEPNLTGATITLSRNGSSTTIPMTANMLEIASYRTITSIGSNTVNGSYYGVPFTATINIVALPDDVIFSGSNPIKAIDMSKKWLEDTIFYGVGNFQINYSYNNTQYYLLSNFITSLDGQKLTVGTQNITFYVGNQSFEYSINVQKNNIKSISVLTTNMTYYALPNEPLILENLAVEIVKENGDSLIIGPQGFSDYDIRISLEGTSVMFNMDYTYGTNLNIPPHEKEYFDKRMSIILTYDGPPSITANVGDLKYGYTVDIDITSDDEGNNELYDYFEEYLTAWRYATLDDVIEQGYNFYGNNFFGEPDTDYTKPFVYSSEYETDDNGLYYYTGFSGWTIDYDEETQTYHLSTTEQKIYCPFYIIDIGYDRAFLYYKQISSQFLNVNTISNERFDTPEDALAFLKDIVIDDVYSYEDYEGQNKLVTIKDVVISKTSYDWNGDVLNCIFFTTTFNEPIQDAYTLRYEWTNAPANVTLPTNSNTYQNYANRAQNFDTTFTENYKVMYNGSIYTFSGWTETISSATSDGLSILLSGKWTKVVHDCEYTSEITTPPTCSENGVRTYTCSICGDSYTEMVPMNRNNHTFGELIPEVPATTTTEGVKEHKTCVHCEMHFDKDGNVLSSLVIEKLPTPDEPTNPPTDEPTNPPTDEPTNPPTDEPTNPPTDEPTNPPTDEPTNPPTDEPTNPPTDEPTNPPTDEPTNPPTDEPTNPPTDEPTNEPSDKPSEEKGGCGTIVPPTIGGNGTNGSGLTALLLSSAFIALLAFTLRFGKKKKASKN